MRNKVMVLAFSTMFFALGSSVEGQPPGKVPRIGYLSPGFPRSSPSALFGANIEAFRQGLRELGYVEGKNIIIEYRYAEQKFERFPELAAELVRSKVDVIRPGGGPASLKAAVNATKTIPIIMVTSSGDPVKEGLIASLARPGGNITGLTQTSELGGKRLQRALGVSDLPKLTNFISFSHGSFRSFGFANVWGRVYYFLIFRLG